MQRTQPRNSRQSLFLRKQGPNLLSSVVSLASVSFVSVLCQCLVILLVESPQGKQHSINSKFSILNPYPKPHTFIYARSPFD